MIVHFVGRYAKHIVQRGTSGFEEMILVTIYAASVPASTMYSFITLSGGDVMRSGGEVNSDGLEESDTGIMNGDICHEFVLAIH